MHLAERLHLHGAGKRDQRVCANIPRGREEAYREQQHDLGQHDELTPVDAAGLPPAQADALRRGHTQRKGQNGDKIVGKPR